jgi:S1-C subfamily serine protease
MICRLQLIIKNKANLKVGDGVYVTEVTGKSGAEDAGIKTGDIVTKIDNDISSFADLSLQSEVEDLVIK